MLIHSPIACAIEELYIYKFPGYLIYLNFGTNLPRLIMNPDHLKLQLTKRKGYLAKPVEPFLSTPARSYHH